MPRVLLPLSFLSAALAFLVACGAGGGAVGNGPGAQTTVQAPRVLDLIRAEPFSRLVLEIDAVTGLGPAEGNPETAAARLAELVDKPGGIVPRRDETLPRPAGERTWTFPMLAAYAASVFDEPVEADTIYVHVLFVDGRFAAPEGRSVLGLAWSHRHIVIFQETLRDACGAGALTQGVRDEVCAEAELAVWMHELGHILGLVDNGLIMQGAHEDDEHPGHDADANCVMYWAYEGDAVVQRALDDVLGSGNAALDFCAQCRADLAAARGN